MWIDKPTPALDVLNLVFLEQSLNALCQPLDCLSLRFLHAAPVKGNLTDLDSMVLEGV
jgi:hypothetical protein